LEKFNLTKRVLPVRNLSERELVSFLRKEGINLTPQEIRRIADILGRDPTLVELHIFNVEWSEHCSYKSSKKILEKFLPTSAPNVILGPVEDAGIIFLTEFKGERYGVVISHESHNHPSQVLPVEGAATGIGGIVRDVDCMGARVVAVADGLRFGDPFGKNRERTKWIAEGVVQGIWEYANALGIPNIGGDVYFSESFDDNCLVNVVAIGVVKEKEIVHSWIPPQAKEIPYDIILVGKPTDSSGFGGAAFASEILDEEKEEEKKGAVQVHDPFLKNVLLLRKANEEVLRRARERGYVIGFKDLGGAGLACASSEIGAFTGIGVEIELDRVHVAMENLLPEVICCAETQERYILAVPHEFTPEVLQIYNQHWELPKIYEGARASVIGRSRKDSRYVIRFKGEVVCDAPIKEIAQGIRYERQAKKPRREWREPEYSPPEDLGEVLLKILGSPNIASKEYVFRYYDTEVQGNAVIRPGEADAGVIAPLEEIGSPVGIALSLDGNPFYGRISPYWGGANAVAEAMRNVACVGATPSCLTDCLNFGNPEKREAFWEFVEGVRGLSDAAKNLWLKGYPGTPTPVVSGNVSFYNESASGKAIDPSPIIACVGILKDYSKAITMQFKKAGSLIYLVGKRYDELGGSEYYRILYKTLGKNVPQVRWEYERNSIYAVIEAIDKGWVRACHDISNGGMAVALAEMLISGRKEPCLGAGIDIQGIEENLPQDKKLFSESSGFILEVPPYHRQELESLLSSYSLPYYLLGETTDKPFFIVKEGKKILWKIPVSSLKEVWSKGVILAFR